MSATRENLEIWKQALDSFDKKDLDDALGIFSSMEQSSKINFNKGMILMELQDYNEAIKEFHFATTRDKFLCVGFFQKGVCHVLNSELKLGVKCFLDAILLMRSSVIDYAQIGLDYKLYKCEIKYNCGIAHFLLNKKKIAIELIQEAIKEREIQDHDVFQEALNDLENAELFQVPLETLFRPPEVKLKNLQRRDYMGKSQVVAALDNDKTTDFEGSRNFKRRSTVFQIPKTAMIKIKINFGHSKMIQTQRELTFQELKRRIETKFNSKPTKIWFMDLDKKLIINHDEDVKMAILCGEDKTVTIWCE